MSDVVVTVPKHLWRDWLDEGTLPGEAFDGLSEYHFFGRGPLPDIAPGERVYIVAHGLLRGYAPLVRIDTPGTLRGTDPSWAYWWWPSATYGLVRHGGAVACTIGAPIRGFQGWRHRWWNREDEHVFPDWQTRGVVL